MLRRWADIVAKVSWLRRGFNDSSGGSRLHSNHRGWLSDNDGVRRRGRWWLIDNNRIGRRRRWWRGELRGRRGKIEEVLRSNALKLIELTFRTI